MHLAPHTPAELLPAGERDPGFAAKPRLVAKLIAGAQARRIPFAAVVADSASGDHGGLLAELLTARVPLVLAVTPRRPHPTTPLLMASRPSRPPVRWPGMVHGS